MVPVQQFHIPVRHNLPVNYLQINRNICQILKPQELAIFILLILNTQNQILRPDSVASLNIHTRFIRCNHARFHHRIVLALRDHFEADAVGALMYAGQVAHPVSGTVFIVKSPSPQWLSGRIIKAESAAAMKELHISQTQHAHKH